MNNYIHLKSDIDILKQVSHTAYIQCLHFPLSLMFFLPDSFQNELFFFFVQCRESALHRLLFIIMYSDYILRKASCISQIVHCMCCFIQP